MAIRITQFWPEKLSLEPIVHVVKAPPQVNMRADSIVVDLPMYWLYIPRDGRIEIEAIDGTN